MQYHTAGAVLELECVDESGAYAAVVRGGNDYEVSLQFADHVWESSCSCPMQYDCKHAVAAMLALQERAVNQARRQTASAAKPRKGKPVYFQPSESPVYKALVRDLGRPLTQREGDFIRKLQSMHANLYYRQPSGGDLNSICPGFKADRYWEPLDLLPHDPEDDLQLWQYIAWELRRRKVAWPEFMGGITDLSSIEEEMSGWARNKEVHRWTEWFRGFDGHEEAPPSQTMPIELRVAIHPVEARLQWRAGSEANFTDLTRNQAKSLAEQFERGSLNIAPESVPLWGAVFNPWQYESWWVFKYGHPTQRPKLSRLLRVALSPQSVVTPDGRPLTRVAEPLRIELTPPGDENDENGDYVLKLVTAEGAPPPTILCRLLGQPTLYITETGIFEGPQAEALDTDLMKVIPAAAIESADGLRFLHATRVPLPERLAKRVRTIPVNVTLSCALKPVYSGSQSEDLVITVTARAPGMKTETFTSNGWQQSQGGRSERANASNGIVPVHDRSAQQHFPRLLEVLGAKASYSSEWRMRLTKKTPEVFVSWLQSLPPEIEVLLDPELATLRDQPISGSVSLDVTESDMDWFDLKVLLNVADTTLTPEELKLLLNARGGYVRLGKKGWRRLQFNLAPEDDEQLARLGLNARDFSAEPQRFHALQLADDAAKKFLAPERVEKIQRRVSELKTRVSPKVSGSIRAEMRPYQIDGYHFLAYLTSNRFGGVLADDMGLGKTLQALAWIAWLRESGDTADGSVPPAIEPKTQNRQPKTRIPSLVVCPKSVMDNWRAEAERFYPGLRVRMWRGEPVEELAAARESSDLIVVNYAQLRSLSPQIADVQWHAAILDEAQYIKNPDSQTAQAARALKAGHRLALTGTPIENRLLDLWSIFAFAMPGALGNRAHFLRRFDAKGDPLARRRLAARVRPFLLRRTKGQVAKDLPDRIEEDLLCEMEGPQQTLYSAELKRARRIILGLKTNKQLNDQRFNILTSLLRLRQICCHPALVDGKLHAAESAKVAALEDLLEPLMEEGHKVLVFSQFVTMLDLLQKTVKQRKWPYFYLAGDTENRGELVKEFQSAEGGAVFLISLKAGGFGLNLTAASYVVLFDPWWNPAVENQAIDRTHRIGQTSNVMAYRLLIRDSIEQKIRALQKQKAALADDVLGEERFSQSLTLDDLRFLFAE